MAAQMKDSSTKRKKPRSSSSSCSFCFSCFWFSSETNSKRKQSFDKVPKRSQWFSWAAKRKSTKKAGLIDLMGKEIQVTKPDKRRPAKRALSSNHVRIGQTPAAVSDQVVHKSNKTRSDNAQEINPGERKSFSKLNKTVETTTSQKGSTAATKTTAPEVNSRTTTTTKVLPQSVSVSPPPPRPQKRAVNGGGAAVNGGGDNINKSSRNGKVDGIVGMSVVMVTLMIMLVWGKVCAILCTSAWFYFVPLFAGSRNYTPNEESNYAREIDTNSEEYKKKVVLQGFLQRNHRNSAAIM